MTPPVCTRCGATIPPAAALGAMAINAYVAIRDRRLVVPDKAMADLRAVADALRCTAGLCTPRAA